MRAKTVLAIESAKDARGALAQWLLVYEEYKENYPEKEALIDLLTERARKAAELIEQGVEECDCLDGKFPLGNEEDASFAGDVFGIDDLVKFQLGLYHLVSEGHYVEPAYDVLVRNGFIAEQYGEWYTAVDCYNGVPLSESVGKRRSMCKKKMEAEGERLFEVANILKTDGIHDEKDYWLTMFEAAEMHHPKATVLVGISRATGSDGFPTDVKEGLDLLSDAAWRGNAEAAYAICELYDKGIEQIDVRDAMTMCSRAAKNGYAPAVERLEKGFDLRPKHEILTERAENGDRDAMWELVKLYEKRGANLDLAGEWLAKAVDAHQPNALVYTAEGYLDKSREYYNEEKAEGYLRIAAEGGHIPAIKLLAERELEQGEVSFWEADAKGEVKPCHEKQFAWYKLTAKTKDADALCKVGYAYYRGYPVEKNSEEAFKWLARAHDYGSVEALYMLGDLFEKGEGVAQNLDTALALYTEAAENGDMRAMIKLYDIYTNGLGDIKPDKDKAFRYLWLSGYGRD